MSNTIFNTRIKTKHDTTANWNAALTFIPLAGELIVYDDYKQVDGTNIPGIKVGDGLAYVVDLPFLDDAIASSISSHINNTSIHVSTSDRSSWNDKVTAEIDEEILILSF